MRFNSIKFLMAFVIGTLPSVLFAQTWHKLYDNEIPGSLKDSVQLNPDDKGFQQASQPGIQVFIPEGDKANGSSILIFPGGGYSSLSWKAEGTDIAKAFCEKGLTCFVVKYRLPGATEYEHREQVPLTDAIAAVRWVKKRAEEYHIRPDKIGAIGFSAGGHVVATLGNMGPYDARPAFSILVYPVISMSPKLTHVGSHDQLLGKNVSPELEKAFSNELQVNKYTPPTYIIHTGDDGLVPVENSILMYQALLKEKIKTEFHAPQSGNHGFIFGIPVNQWLDPMMRWLKDNDMVRPKIDGKGKTVILTFDDASASHYQIVSQMLRTFNFGATFYVCEFPPDFADTSKYMNWRQIKELSKMGFEIGNHTWHHVGVNSVNSETLFKEIKYIEDKCKEYGISKPTSFCYPFYNTDSAALPMLSKMGYLTARTGGDKPWDAKVDDPYLLPSYTIAGDNAPHFYKALEQASPDNAIIFCVHGVPDNAHGSVSTPPEVFERYLKYLYDNHFTVVSMREYSKKQKLKVPKKN